MIPKAPDPLEAACEAFRNSVGKKILLSDGKTWQEEIVIERGIAACIHAYVKAAAQHIQVDMVAEALHDVENEEMEEVHRTDWENEPDKNYYRKRAKVAIVAALCGVYDC